MNPWIVTLIILLVVAGILFALYFFGNKMQKQQLEQKEQIKEAAQMTSMLIIDKKMMKLKDAGLPKIVLEQTPKRYRNAKMPIVKAKVGPQTVNLICDDAIFDDVPTKCEVKAMVSGIYLTEIKSVRGKRKNQPEVPQKKSFAQKMRKKQSMLQAEYAKEEKAKEAKKAAKEAEKKKKEQAKKITD
jgi:hypothetical protein